MKTSKETLRNLGLDGWIFGLTSLAAIIFSILSFFGVLPFNSQQTSSTVIGALGILMAAVVTQTARRHAEILELKNTLSLDALERRYSQMNAFFSILSQKEKNQFAEVLLIFGLRAYGKVLSDRTVSVDRDHSLEFWLECIRKCNKQWFAVTYTTYEESWGLMLGDYIGRAVQDERIRAGAAIKRVFVIDDEEERAQLKRVMEDHKSIGVEVRWIFRKDIPQSRMVKESIEALGTLDLVLVDDYWIWRAHLDRTRHITSCDASSDEHLVQKAKTAFTEIFGKGNKV